MTRLQIKQVFRDLNITSFFISADCTDYVQVLNVIINKSLKDRIKELTNIHYDENFEKWDKESYTVEKRRIMLTKWVSQIWKKFHKEKSETIRRIFRKLRLSLVVNESEDDEIRIKNLENIEIDEWRLSSDAQKDHNETEDLKVEEQEKDMKEYRQNMNEVNENQKEQKFEYVMKTEMHSEEIANAIEKKNRNSESDMKEK